MRAVVTAAGGQVRDERQIGEIYYHAMLLEMPAAAIQALIMEPTAGLSAVDEAMFLRPQTLAPIKFEDLGTEKYTGPLELPSPSIEAPIVALMDGLPLARHRLLSGRLDLDDPDDISSGYAAADQQQHGTAMASIIIHGDANEGLTTVKQRLYVRPVLQPAGGDERFPGHGLALYLMFEAFTRMLVSVDGRPAAAPNVRIVNISLGDPNRRFAGTLSPWARLLDYFAFRYRLLILVSAGNICDDFVVPGVENFSELEDMAPSERRQHILSALMSLKAYRRILAPAEAINVLTVGARHADAITPVDAGEQCVTLRRQQSPRMLVQDLAAEPMAPLNQTY